MTSQDKVTTMPTRKKPPIHVVDVDDDYPDLWSEIGQCGRCYLDKEIAETVIYVFPKYRNEEFHHVIGYDICKDCLPFVKAKKGHPDVERRREEAWKNPYTSKEWNGELCPYMHCNRSRWRSLEEIRRGIGLPNYNIEGEPPVPGVTTWLKGHDDKNNPIWEKRPYASTVSE